MDYIDWIISSVVFLIVITLVLVTISNLIPIKDNTNEALLNGGLFQSVSEVISVYNVSIDNPDGEIYPYQINNISKGRAQNSFVIDSDNNISFGTVSDKDKFYNYETTIDSSSGLGTLILEENFDDFNYLDTFVTSENPEIKSGILEITTQTDLNTINTYSDYTGLLSTNSDFITIYLSYTDINNNYYCEFSNQDLNLYSTIDGATTLIDNETEIRTTDWAQIYFGYTNEGIAFCKTKTTTAQSTTLTIPETKIIISTTDIITYIDDFYIFLTDNLISENSSSTIMGKYIDGNIADNLATINILKDGNIRSTLDFNFTENLVVPDTNGIVLVKDGTQENKLLFFPQTKEFWFKVNVSEDLNITIDDSLNNFGTAYLNGTLQHPEFEIDDYLDYRIPLTFKSTTEISADSNVSFDVDFSKAFLETTTTGEDGTTEVFYCDYENSCQSLDYNLNYSSGIGEFIIKLPAIDANAKFNIYVYFSSQTIDNVSYELISAESMIPEQLTAQIENNIITDTTNQFYFYNFVSDILDINETIIFNIFDENLFNSNCDINFSNRIINISNCENNASIKVRFRFTDLEDTVLDYPKISVTKTKEQIVPQDKFDNLNCEYYYLNLKNKTTDLNCSTGSNPQYTNTTAYLSDNGLEERVKLSLKMYNELGYGSLNASVTSPAEEAIFYLEEDINFTSLITNGSGDYSCNWSSNIYEEISKECSFSTTNLSVGKHTITLTVLDNKHPAYTATDSIIIYVTELAEDCVSGGNPYVICVVEDLETIAKNLEGDYVLGKDIDFFNPSDWTNPPDGINTTTDNWNSGEGFAPIGDSKFAFSGAFDGNGFTLTNLYINRPLKEAVGLFGIANRDSVITNTRLEDVNIIGGAYVGGLVGVNSGNLDKSYSTGNIVGNDEVGGLIGRLVSGTIANMYSTANIVTHNSIGGGLIGLGYGGTINYCYSAGEVSGNTVGGLIGSVDSTTSTNCFWDTETSKQKISAGNETGLTTIAMKQETTFSGWNFVNVWDINEEITYPFLRNIENESCSSGGNPYVICVVEDLETIAKNLEGDYVLGKDIDFFNPSDWTNPPDGINTTTDNWNSGEGFAPIRGGGKEQFAGSFNGNGFTLTNLYINRPSEDFVGLFGITDAGSIINVRLEDVNIVGGNYVGGLVGANSGTLAISYSTGTVEGAAAVGGLIGKFSNGTIANVYSTANVIVHQDIGGGLIGEIVTGELNNSYSAGEVNGDKATYIGGLIGRNGDGIITNCFWDKDTSKQETSAGSEIGLHTSEMMDSKIFTNWDFKDIWDIVESKTYPFLR